MNSGVVALILSAIALGVAGFALTAERQETERTPIRLDRVADLETEIEKLKQEIALLKSAKPQPGRRSIAGLPTTSLGADDNEFELPAPRGGTDDALTAIVEDAVDRKTKQVLADMRLKANKKPAIGVFASALELSKDQRAVAERVIVEGQRKVHDILNMPTSNGTKLMDELVEIVARGIAEPGKDHGWAKLIGRILNEKVPGTDVTYAAQVESVKQDMRARFKREWSAEQYTEFHEWKVDPTEIQNVPGSPNEALMVRINERARTLGAQIPDPK